MALLLDLFCGAGGVGMGYAQAGFTVVGVDVQPQPRYPFGFMHADALWVLRELVGGGSVGGYSLTDIAVIHASPPCQQYSRCRYMRQREGRTYPDLVAPMRALLRQTGKPYLIENVPGAPLEHPVWLCGQMFGLPVLRHRGFESNYLLLAPAHPSHRGLQVGRDFVTVAGHITSQQRAREAMGIDWMQTRELAQAIPPVYTWWLGSQLAGVVS